MTETYDAERSKQQSRGEQFGSGSEFALLDVRSGNVAGGVTRL